MALVEIELAQVVAQLHHLARLDEGGKACGALVLNETFDFATVGGEQGNDGAAVADGDLGAFGGPPFALGTGQRAIDLSLHLGGLAGFGATYLGKGW